VKGGNQTRMSIVKEGIRSRGEEQKKKKIEIYEDRG
jgi:hypothetical protein